MRRRSPHRVAVDALRLRAWAMRVLIAGDPTPPPDVSAEGWELFGEMEWCAEPLRARLREAGVWDECGGEAVRELSALADGELRRITSAREELARAASLASEVGARVVALKGSAAVAEGADVHLADIDLLTTPEHAAALADALREGGLRESREPHTYVFHPRSPGGAAVEVHHLVRSLGATEDVLAAAVPLPGIPGLWRLPADEHAWHLLSHSVVKHPDRIARLRDLLLIRAAMDACTPDEQATVGGRAEADPRAADLLAVLAMARTGAPSPDAERYVRRRYFLLARWRRLGSVRVAQVLLRQVLLVATTAAVWPGEVIRRHLSAPTDLPSTLGFASRRRLHPTAVRAIRVSARLPLVGAALSLAWLASLENRLTRR
jgi:hypothetical protein